MVRTKLDINFKDGTTSLLIKQKGGGLLGVSILTECLSTTDSTATSGVLYTITGCCQSQSRQ